ncbi:1-pyrroline-5-carboxylate dehydrogenase [Phlyctochytrium bullatum]|nr:1-pyrroline-5-carboxylate dehydrogenase [Phlyctochytrium bullatum]
MRHHIESSGPFKVPAVVNGSKVFDGQKCDQVLPFEHKTALCTYPEAISTALSAKEAWEAMPFNDRASIFLKAADLLSSKYRYKLMAATMLGQGKNAWQAEIDAAAELCDFWRFNTLYAAAYSPFNFTAIGGNLPSAPALMGNVVLWKPSKTSIYSNYLIMEILHEAGLPEGVIQFIPGDAEMVTETTFTHPEFAGLHFTGSTAVFKMLWKKIAQNLDVYKSYPRIVGETGGKNMHFIHKSADAKHAALQTVRSAFEYMGQKCSACSRVYVPDNLWPEFQETLKLETQRLKIGSVDSKHGRERKLITLDFENFMSAVINKQSYDKISGYLKAIKDGKEPSSSILVGGNFSDAEGYFIEPTVIVTTDPKARTMVDELFGPVVTVYVYPADQYEQTLKLADSTTSYALTAALFARDRGAIIAGSNALRNAAGNFYVNDKSTGAVVGRFRQIALLKLSRTATIWRKQRFRDK